MNREDFQSRILLAAGALERAWGRLTGDETLRARGERDRHLARLLQATSHVPNPATIAGRRSAHGRLTGGSGK
jgi:uncharacterized protein YjbJ (UPF0337 family)